MFDRPIIRNEVRSALFGGRMSPSQEAGLDAILNEWEQRRPSADLRWLAYMLATAFHETARTMQPIREFGKGRGRRYGVPDPATGETYYGRGYVQLTWKSNYDKSTRRFGQDFVNNPDLALSPPLAAAIMFGGMTDGWFTGKKLGDYFSPGREDWRNARRIINGLDHADTIAGYGRQFMNALAAGAQGGSVIGTATTMPPPSVAAMMRGSPKSDAVLALQTALGEKGYMPGPLDGEFGPLTEQALLAFQKDNGLVPTGVFEPAQWLDLARAPARALPAERVQATQETLRELGSTTIAQTDRAKRAAIGAGVLSALGLGDSQTNMLGGLFERLQAGLGAAPGAPPGLLETLVKLGIGVASPGGPALWLGLAGLATYLWRSANAVAEQRVDDHRTAANVRDLKGR
jgi:peptidoglycan hydrolase-like protein with peptidoglycan-binding domain